MMKQEPVEMEMLEEMLRQVPERDVPAGLGACIMAQVLAAEQPRSRIAHLWQWMAKVPLPGLSFRHIGAAIATAMVAFWLGMHADDGKQAQKATAPSITGHLVPLTENARANYLIGRGLFEAGVQDLALAFFQQATLQEPQSAQYNHWQGVAYWKLGDHERERQSYEHSLVRYPDYIPALLNLGHNLLESGDYQGALRYYSEVLRFNPYEQTALYNLALVHLQLGDTKAARAAFHNYLNQYRSDRRAYWAAEHLQQLGIFAYRICPLGGRKVVINQEVLLGPAVSARQLELERIARWLDRASAVELHLVVYSQHDSDRGKSIAEDLGQQLHAIMDKNVNIPVRISWFDEPAPVRTADGKEQKLPLALLLFTQPLKTQGGSV